MNKTILELIDINRKKPSFQEQFTLFVENPEWIPDLWETVKSDLPHPYPEYAAWWWLHLGLKHPEKVKDYQQSMLDLMLIDENQSVLRSVVRVLSTLPYSTYNESECFERLLSFVEKETNKVALQVYALYTLVGYVQRYPELKSEIETLLEFKEELGLQPAMKVGIRNFRKAVKNL